MNPPPPSFHSHTLQGILWMILGMFAFSLMNTLIRGIATDIDTRYMVFLRNILSFALVLYVPFRHGWQSLRTERLRDHIWRGAIGIATMELWFYSISIMPLTQATALSFTTPIFVTIFAILFLGEKAGIRRWSAIALGFAGAMMILRPTTHGVSHAALFVLTASAMMAVTSVVVKTLTRTESPSTIVFYMALFFTLFSFPLSIGHWQALTLNQWAGMTSIAVFSTIAQFSLAKAYTKAEMVTLMPFDFVRLIFISILAYFFFGETLDIFTLLGSVIILASSVYIVHREMRLKRQPAFDDSAITR